MVAIVSETSTPRVALPPFAATRGPRDARIALVGEAWGEKEEMLRKPFCGEAGKELFLMLCEAIPDIAPELASEARGLMRYDVAWVKAADAWYEEAKIFSTNVFALRPPGNKIDELCVKRGELPSNYSWPLLAQGKYVREEFEPELARLFAELAEVRPNLVIALGNTACWALLRQTNIGSIRGTITRTSGRVYGVETDWKVLPTYHPAGVLRQWAWRPIVVADFMKATREAEFPEVRRPDRQIVQFPEWSEGALPAIERWVAETLASPPPLLAADTETAKGQITVISFARSRSTALVVPFVNKWVRPPASRSFWPEAWMEERAWDLVAQLLESPIPTLWQNGLYDLQYLLPLGIRARIDEDTMLLHHSLYPEMKKGLGFLGSVYTGEPAWKLMRVEKADTEKRDE